MLCLVYDTNYDIRGNVLFQNRCNSLPCTVRTYKQWSPKGLIVCCILLYPTLRFRVFYPVLSRLAEGRRIIKVTYFTRTPQNLSVNNVRILINSLVPTHRHSENSNYYHFSLNYYYFQKTCQIKLI